MINILNGATWVDLLIKSMSAGCSEEGGRHIYIYMYVRVLWWMMKSAYDEWWPAAAQLTQATAPQNAISAASLMSSFLWQYIYIYIYRIHRMYYIINVVLGSSSFH